MTRKIFLRLLILLLFTGCDLSTLSDDTSDTIVSEVDTSNISFDDDFYTDYLLDDYTVINGESSSYTITEAGTYLLTGEINSTVTVEVGDDDDVRLVLNGVDINSSDGPAILIISADDVEISVVESSINYLEDASTRSNTDYTGAIYSDCDLLFNGTGTLYITGNYNNALITKDDLTLINLTMNITSVDDGIIGKDSLITYGADITVDSEGDAIKSSHESDSEKGYIYVYSGTFDLTSGDEGITAENIITIESGDFTIDADGHGIDSVLDITIEDGTINMTDCTEGIEGQTVTINGGSLTIDASDDGINCSSDSSSDITLTINGGVIDIISYGDSIDVNGSATITDGTITLNGPTSHEKNSTFDIDDGYEIDGGVVFAFGNSDLVTSPSSSSAQASLSITTDSTYSAGTVATLKDSTGDIILSDTSVNGFDHILISTPKLITGSSYTITIDDCVEFEFTVSSVVTYLN